MAMKDMLLLLAVSSLVSSYVIAHDHEGLHITIPPKAHDEDHHHHLAYIPIVEAMHSEVKLRRSVVQKPSKEACAVDCENFCNGTFQPEGRVSCLKLCLQNCQ